MGLIVEKRPPTWEAFRWYGDTPEIEKALKGTDWEVIQFVPEYIELVKGEQPLYSNTHIKKVEMGWYVVVSSRGKVKVMDHVKFVEEFKV